MEKIQSRLQLKYGKKMNDFVNDMLREYQPELLKCDYFFWEHFSAETKIRISITTRARPNHEQRDN